MNLRSEIWYSLAGFIMDNKSIVIRFINDNGYGRLSENSSLDQVNLVVADNLMKSPAFTEQLVLLQRNVEEGDYYNAVAITIATVVSQIGQAIANIAISAKNAVFAREQAARQEQYGYETEEFYKELADLNARKEIAIELGKAQTDILLKRDVSEEKEKRTNTLMIFGVFAIGAIALAMILKRK